MFDAHVPGLAPRVFPVLLLVAFCSSNAVAADPAPPLKHPVLFVTQVPVPADFTTIGSTFGNHLGSLQAVARGGDLWICYPDGSLRNLTEAAGLGMQGFQGADAIAVRDPCVHWDAEKAVFSMLVGASTKQYQWTTHYWQLYEITGLGPTDVPVVTEIPHQPETYNNISPVYGSDDRILFTSDRPFNGMAHLHPQLDEYEEAPVVTGLWSLDPVVGDLFLLTHAPSGDFTPILDSFGRVLFTRWDHLQRDQQADADNGAPSSIYGTFNWSDESSASVPLPTNVEFFPEPRAASPDLPAGSHIEGHSYNHFFPWMIMEDGSELETLNHIGRHELHNYFNRAFNNDSNLKEFIATASGTLNPNRIGNLFQIAEDPTQPGHYFGVDAPEFQTHASGRIVSMSTPPGVTADTVTVTYETHPDTVQVTSQPGPDHTGHYRDPLPLGDGRIVAAHTPETDKAKNLGTTAAPVPRYDFRLRLLDQYGAYLQAGAPLTPGIHETVSYWNPDVLVTYSGELWELNPVEVRPRPRPAGIPTPLESPETQAFVQAGVSINQFRGWLYQHGLALLVTRNVTSRDAADRQQPFNLRVDGGSAQTLGQGGKIYDVKFQQFVQADLLRGLGGVKNPKPGRRVLAQPMHDATEFLPPLTGAPEGSVQIGRDGSTAAVVPARRALSWQITDANGEPVVRERNWLSFQPGEIRACASCHGLNGQDQAGGPVPTNTPGALVDLLEHWKKLPAPTPSLADLPAAAGAASVLSINGSAGGVDRRVDVAANQSITISMAGPPPTQGPADFMLFGLLGVPSALNEFNTPVGPMVFPPAYVAPALPGFFTLANSLFADPEAVVQAAPVTPSGWNLNVPQGLATPLTVTLQGIVEASAAAKDPWLVTNAIILRVQ